ncbi:GST2 [Candida pseudojiufengensis]|uniref:GST2 n=1 Tax=Candida pseudojiufengensis TaxID=497109 RepID=UPI0022256D6D|nr:GST2 [Candida pseudojiufengensis]KAI5962121.1 GST2 [Candida pseudojiufengensis]
MSLPIKLYTFGTPNGFKASIILELLGLKYDVISVDITKNESKSDWFEKLNPNGRIPTIEDPNFKGGEGKGEPLVLSQTGAILQYLVDTYDKDHKYSYPFGTKDYYKTLEYLIFQVSENGPIQGQANHFVLFSKEKHPYAINRYLTDTKRIYGVYEDILSRNKENDSKYLVGDRYTVADIALFGWSNSLKKLDIDIHDWPLLGKWFDSLSSLPAVQKGLKVPAPKQ